MTYLKIILSTVMILQVGQNLIGQNGNGKSETKFKKSEFVDQRDGQHYRLITIGNQTWFAENLNFVSDSSYCSDDNCKSCGRLYYFSAAIKVCPKGFHLPSEAEWDTLCINLGGRIDSTQNSGTFFYDINKVLINKKIFAARYCGMFRQNPFDKTIIREFFGFGSYSAFWTSTFKGSIYIGRHMEKSNWFGTVDGDLSNGFCVRCLSDN